MTNPTTKSKPITKAWVVTCNCEVKCQTIVYEESSQRAGCSLRHEYCPYGDSFQETGERAAEFDKYAPNGPTDKQLVDIHGWEPNED